ncbi:MAG: hypothetical protein ACE5LV_03475 [Candidatus Aminicenantales bacterium]
MKTLSRKIALMILFFSLALLFCPRPAQSSEKLLHLNGPDIKDILYKPTQKTVFLELQQPIEKRTTLLFRNFTKREALQLMALLTSGRGVLVRVDLESRYVYDHGFRPKSQDQRQISPV